MEKFAFPARDGYQLSGELHQPAGEVRSTVLIAGAMGVRQAFYSALAKALMDRGVAALTFDYRGVGRSRPSGSLRGFHAELHDWGEKDLGGAMDLLRARFPAARRLWIGHSAGGQLLGLCPELPERALCIGSQSGYFRNWTGIGRALMWLFWHVSVPASTTMLGYLPMRALGQGEDLPYGVGQEWARWGRHPRYIGSYAGDRLARFPGPLRLLSVADDSYAPLKSVQALAELYSGAKPEVVTIRPDGRAIGHFGWFRQPALWTPQLDWLLGTS